ncbi:MAG: pstC [Betaproteobacteria bacterium]|jgi:phosphate transport system permease protein|nr:pstC [Betaproteobacteria bacterium]
MYDTLGDALLRRGSLLALCVAVALLALIVGFIVSESRLPPAPGLSLSDFLFFERWDPSGQPPKYGIGHAWVATLLIVGLAVALATPLALVIAVFLSEIAPPAVRSLAEPMLQLLAGIPAVVYGFVGYATLVPLLERWLPTGETILIAAVVLALMVLPFIAASAAEALSLVGRDLRRAGLSLGVSRWYAFSRVTLRKATPGVLAGVILGMGRGLGETLAVLMLAGNSPIFPDGLLSRGQPLTALIATDLGESAIHSERYYALFSAGLLLMLSVIAINLLVLQIKRKFIGAGRN